MSTHTHNKTNLLNNFALKVIALAIGYLVWFLISAHHTVQTTVTIPVVTYCESTKGTVPASLNLPEKINVTVRAPRKELPHIIAHLAAHINETHLTPGEHQITVTPELLFLPDTAQLIHSLPAVITLQKSEVLNNTSSSLSLEIPKVS